MKHYDIHCNNFANKVINNKTIDEDTKIKLLQLINDFQKQYHKDWKDKAIQSWLDNQ